MHNCNSLFMIKMRMCILINFFTMCSPSCMSNSQVFIMHILWFSFKSLYTVTTKSICRSKFISLKLLCLRINTYYPAGVISSWFQGLNAIHAYWSCILLVPNVPNYSTALILNLLHLHLFIHIGTNCKRSKSCLKSNWSNLTSKALRFSKKLSEHIVCIFN